MRATTGYRWHCLSQKPGREVWEIQPDTRRGELPPLKVVFQQQRATGKKYTVKVNGMPFAWKGQSTFPTFWDAQQAIGAAILAGEFES